METFSLSIILSNILLKQAPDSLGSFCLPGEWDALCGTHFTDRERENETF